MKLKKELRAVKEINEQERKKRDEPGDDDDVGDDDFLSYIFIVSGEYKDYTFDYDDMAG